IPDTLIGVLGARIDRLPEREREREVAQTASVIGREFATRLLRAVMRPTSEEEAPDIEPQLGSLTVEGLLSQTRRARFADYRVKHEFARDTAYARLLLKRRRELHARCTRAWPRSWRRCSARGARWPRTWPTTTCWASAG